MDIIIVYYWQVALVSAVQIIHAPPLVFCLSIFKCSMMRKTSPDYIVRVYQHMLEHMEHCFPQTVYVNYIRFHDAEIS